MSGSLLKWAKVEPGPGAGKGGRTPAWQGKKAKGVGAGAGLVSSDSQRGTLPEGTAVTLDVQLGCALPQTWKLSKFCEGAAGLSCHIFLDLAL